MDEALMETTYRRDGECVQLVIMLKDNVSIEEAFPHANECVGVLAANVAAAGAMDTPMLVESVPTLNAVLAVLPDVLLPLELQSPVDLLDVDWSIDRRKILECLLQCSSKHKSASFKSGKKHAGAVQRILNLEINMLDQAETQLP